MSIVIVFVLWFECWLKFNEPIGSCVAECRDLKGLRRSLVFLLGAFIGPRLLGMFLSRFISLLFCLLAIHDHSCSLLYDFMQHIFLHHPYYSP